MPEGAAVTNELLDSAEQIDVSAIKGVVSWAMYDEDGNLKSSGSTDNLVTAVGDQFYAGRAVLASGLPAALTGMKLGTGSTAVAKTGAGAALVAYITGSNKAFDATYPTAVAGVATFRRTYAPGEGTTATEIREVVLVTDTISSDATSVVANTVARALLPVAASGGPGVKNAGDQLVVTWTHTLTGS